MKTFIHQHGRLKIFVIAISILVPTAATLADGKPWVLRKVTTSNTCNVQKSTASPIGDLVSDYDTRKDACVDAAARYDSNLSDSSKCWTYGGGTVDACKAEGVPLPPKIAARAESTYKFVFVNTNPDQTFQVTDQIDTSHNPIFSGAVNHGDTSPPIHCWVGSDGKCKVQVDGTVSGIRVQDIDNDGFQFNY